MRTSIPITSNVFVYGTLKRGQCREKMWPRPPLSIRPGYVRGTLFDLGPYPAMWCADCHEWDSDAASGNDHCDCDWIEGEIWTLAKSDMSITIEELDVIEETNQPSVCNQYDQILVRAYETPCQAGNRTPSVLALTYQFSDIRKLPATYRIQPVGTSNIVAWPK